MSNISILDDHRPRKGACTISFIGFEFITPEGEPMKLSRSFAIENGDFEGAIEAVKQNGGAYLPSQDGGKTYWFLPWPCAAVRICPDRK